MAYVNKEKLRDILYEEDAITFKGLKILNTFPEEDVVEVVRCKDCKFHNTPSCPMLMALNWTDDKDFCNYGERSDT